MKGFMILLAGMLVFGLALGGAFVAGTIVGGGDEEATAATTPSIPAPTTGGQTDGGQSLRQQLAAQIQSGELTPQDIARLRQQFAGGGAGAGAGAGGGGFLAGRAVQGTIEGIEGNVITLNTFQGPIQVTVASEATIQVTKQASSGTCCDRRALRRRHVHRRERHRAARGGFRGLGGGRGAGGGGRGLGGGATGGAGGQ